MVRILVAGVLVGSMLLAPAPRSAAQGGGFTAGDLYLHNAYVTGYGPGDGAVLRIDPLTGDTTTLVDLSASLAAHQGVITFDPYRQRLLFVGAVGAGQPLRLWMSDGAGNLQTTAFTTTGWHSATSTGDGRIYFVLDTSPNIRWLDAAGSAHVLMDQTGLAPVPTAGTALTVHGLIYDPGTNALFEGDTDNGICPGGMNFMTSVRKYPLTADGSQLRSPAECVQYDVSPGGGEGAVGWGRLPGGLLLLVVDTNTNNLEPRMLVVDPATLNISVWASNDNTFAATTTGGTSSSALGKAVIFNPSEGLLRAFAFGEAGAGAAIVPSDPITASPGGGVQGALIEIPASDCLGGWIAYGEGLAGAGGFVPTLTGVDCPNLGAAVSLRLADARGAAPCVLFLGLGATSVPFKGGHFLVDQVFLNVAFPMPGAAGVPGMGDADIPLVLPGDPLLAGVSVYLQAGFLDAAAPVGVSLTQGLQLELG